MQVHATTVRRWLKRLGFGYRRARPTLCIRDPNKAQRLQAIADALANSGSDCEVFYADEADIDLNPRIGPAWMARGRQSRIPTPGQNQKHYLAGALNARTGKVVWAEGERKDSLLFVDLLYRLKRLYRRARRIVLVVDNVIVHKSSITSQWLANNGTSMMRMASTSFGACWPSRVTATMRWRSLPGVSLSCMKRLEMVMPSANRC